VKTLAQTLLACFSLAAVNVPNAAVDLERGTAKTRKLVLAGGCFWCTEAVFEPVKGVSKVVSGYAGGDAKTAHYEMVGSGRTNHAEVIEITYDPTVISYGQLLKIFFQVAHDPTQKDRQGPDYGRQYRSAIFYASADEKRVAEAYIKQLNEAGVFGKPIATTIEQLTQFFPAEDYHQDYVANNPLQPYVRVNSVPKVEKLKRDFPEWLKKK
jgi:peptide-methionine (S)-S-oxide reductase